MGRKGAVLKRAVAGVALVFAALVAAPHAAIADDPGANAERELAQSSDFRVKVGAALIIGRLKPAGARDSLEGGLNDGHPAVRAASAAALAQLGDWAAVPALERHAGSESSASVKAQMQSTVEQLRKAQAAAAAAAQAAAPAPAAAPDDSPKQLSAGVKYVVKIGTMRNGSGVRGDDLRRVLHDAARSRAHALRGAAITDGDAATMKQAAKRHLPVFTIEGAVTQIIESRDGANVQVQAKVEFTLKQDSSLKGTLSGSATTLAESQTLSDAGRSKLEDDAVDGAVQSALRGADQGFTVATR
jgi:hypothetical protein